MGKRVGEIMTIEPCTINAAVPAIEAAQIMRDADVGAVVVVRDGRVCGIVTDRDITVRAVAEGLDPRNVPTGDVCSEELTVLSPSDSVEEAMHIMRARALRRIPVVENGKPVGIISLGDVALERDPASVLAEISDAPANH
jgi:CBS domain-containing protein